MEENKAKQGSVYGEDTILKRMFRKDFTGRGLFQLKPEGK